MRCLENAIANEQVVVAHSNNQVLDENIVEVYVCAACRVVNQTPVGSFTHRIVHRRHRHRLRCTPVLCGEGERRLVEADLAVGIVERDGNIGGRRTGKHNRVAVGRTAFSNCCRGAGLGDGDVVQ